MHELILKYGYACKTIIPLITELTLFIFAQLNVLIFSFISFFSLLNTWTLFQNKIIAFNLSWDVLLHELFYYILP